MKKRFSFFAWTFLLLCGTLTLEVSANSPPGGYQPGILTLWDILFYIILALPGLLVTLVTERLVARMLPEHRQYLTFITVTNIISQVVMHYLYLQTYTILYPYQNYSIIVLEMLVYTVEFLIYKKRMKEVPAKKILLYTILANTASLLAGGAIVLLALWYIRR